MRGSRGGPDPGKAQVAIGFLRNTSKDPPREAILPKGVQLLLEVGLYTLCENADDVKKNQVPTSDRIFWIHALY